MPEALKIESTLARLALAALAVVAAVSAALQLAPGEVSLLPCPVRLATGVPCPGCGMTRASIALARGDLGGALELQPLALLVVPLLVAVALAPAWSHRQWRRLGSPLRSGVLLAAFVLAIGLWVVRIT